MSPRQKIFFTIFEFSLKTAAAWLTANHDSTPHSSVCMLEQQVEGPDIWPEADHGKPRTYHPSATRLAGAE